MSKIDKKVKIELAGLNGNAFFLMGIFSKNAVKQGWTPEEIKTVMDEAMSSDYDHLLQVLIAHTEPPDVDEDEDDSENS